MHVRVHSADEQDLVLVVHGHDDEQLRPAAHEVRPKGVLVAHKVVRVARRSRVAELRHLLRLVQVPRDDVRWHVHVEHEVALLELDMAHGASLHELLACDRIPGALLAKCIRPLLGRVVALVGHRGHLLHGACVHIIPAGVEVGLGAGIGAAVRLGFPVVVLIEGVVVLLGLLGKMGMRVVVVGIGVGGGRGVIGVRVGVVLLLLVIIHLRLRCGGDWACQREGRLAPRKSELKRVTVCSTRGNHQGTSERDEAWGEEVEGGGSR